MSLRYLSVCSGIEAASVAWHPLDWTAVAYSEIEPFPCAVLKHHYPETPNWGDMTQFQEWPDAVVDVLVGGTPCQSFSVAGLRAGLDDPRGSLMLTYLALARRYRPTWVVWENVPGVLSSNDGRDFGSFLGGLAELGYGFAYRVLDAQYLGLAQRRARVFVVGHLGDWRRAAAVLFERESLSGHPAPRREAGQVAPTLSSSGAGTSRTGNSRTEAEFLIAPTLDVRAGRSGETTLHTSGGLISEVAPTLPSLRTAGGGLGTDFDCDGGLIPDIANALETTCHDYSRAAGFNMIAHSLRAEGFDASEDGIGRGTPLIAFDTTQITSASNYSRPKAGDPCHPHAARAHPPAIAFDARQSDVLLYGEKSGPLDTDGHTIAVAFHENQRAEVIQSETAWSLKVGGGKPGQGRAMVNHGMQVRRLTPLECERLQGFPDNYTLIPMRKRKRSAEQAELSRFAEATGQADMKWSADGPRYKALGNSMAVPVMAWIGRRIDLVHRLLVAA